MEENYQQKSKDFESYKLFNQHRRPQKSAIITITILLILLSKLKFF